jgi:hypothetical protein
MLTDSLHLIYQQLSLAKHVWPTVSSFSFGCARKIGCQQRTDEQTTTRRPQQYNFSAGTITFSCRFVVVRFATAEPTDTISPAITRD